jgi:hypothetical protein
MCRTNLLPFFFFFFTGTERWNAWNAWKDWNVKKAVLHFIDRSLGTLLERTPERPLERLL